MQIITPIASFIDNYIWQIRETDNPVAAFVDPGDANPVLLAVARSYSPIITAITRVASKK
uniref:Uncharacterized protein n=1 Tax=Candidatus Kentrum sp. LPFa TaxID=2126335 RepID=A0A450WXX0_9GAMM|nr:MAG: hypothetical protein BECKLPF1236B_GA0070989_12802 [Candidatus Kentron sp. LPFa]